MPLLAGPAAPLLRPAAGTGGAAAAPVQSGHWSRTSSFPWPGPVINWHDDYGDDQPRHAAARERDRRQAGHAGRGGRGRARAHALAGRRRLEPDADDVGRQQVRLPAPRPGRRTARARTCRGCATAPASSRRSASAGAASRATRPPRRRSSGSSTCRPAAPPVDPYELLASARRLPAAARPAPAAPGKLRLTGVLTWSARGTKAALAAHPHGEHRPGRRDAARPAVADARAGRRRGDRARDGQGRARRAPARACA